MAEREEEEKSRGFKVDDRRRFSAEGELKPEHQGAAQQESEPQRSRPQTEGVPPHIMEGAAPRTSERRAAAMGSAAASHPEINFTTFVVSLSTQALMHLGEIPDPMTNQQQRDLSGAQHMIDILGMLQEKTRGNLDHDEEGLLRSILFDLRMKYVETARHNPGS
jgi:Domain of unknown function (DUF1844)